MLSRPPWRVAPSARLRACLFDLAEFNLDLCHVDQQRDREVSGGVDLGADGRQRFERFFRIADP